MGITAIRSITLVRRQVESDATGFEPLLNPVEVFKLIRSAATAGARVDLYFTRSGRRVVAEAVDSEIITPGLHLRVNFGVPPAAQGDSCMAIIFLRGHLLLCLHTDHVQWMGNHIRLLPSWRAFSLQRRRQVRFEIPTGYEILMDLDAREGRRRRIQRRVMDISSGGLAFDAASRSEAGRYKQGDRLRYVAIRIENKLIFADARVSREATSRGTRIGIQFTRISQVDRNFLLGYVARHMIQSVA